MKKETYDRIRYYTVQKFEEYLYYSGHDGRLATLLEISVSANEIDRQLQISVTGSQELMKILERDEEEESATKQIVED